MTRTLIGGVGYGNLTDLSFGPLFVEKIAGVVWPEGVVLEDLSYGPLFIMHSLDEHVPFDRIVFVGAVRRDTTAGEIRRYRWNHVLPDNDEVQARVVEAATGVISIENLLVVTTFFKKLPPDVVVIEVEPDIDDCGQDLSARLELAVPRVLETLQKLVSGANEPLQAYDYIIADANERPSGWIVRPSGER